VCIFKVRYQQLVAPAVSPPVSLFFGLHPAAEMSQPVLPSMCADKNVGVAG
jgi:hypothetical protein